ncbi:MAG: polysaccharide deacetylase family protein, partial [Hyphomicrobium sp.]
MRATHYCLVSRLLTTVIVAGALLGVDRAFAQTAQDAAPPPSAAAPAAARPNNCSGRADVIGVSRVVEINTAGGQMFGQQQYKDNDFLADGEVVLTFDDGPLRRYTIPVLQALDAHCTKATFFVVGRMAIADPELVRETARRGHTIGTHTWSHRNQRTLGQGIAKGEVELAISSVRKTAGQPTAPFFRYPYLADSRAMTAHLKSRNTGIFSIDVDSRDFRTKNPADVQRTILAQLA